jgi:ornithine cyclodeaminase/alanine dehydrogenase-like protein (mu-crystallin family)
VGAWHDGRQHGATSARGTLSFVKREYSAGMKKIGMGLVGPGFVAEHHIDAVRRLGDVDVVAIAGSSQQSAEKKRASIRWIALMAIIRC